MSTPGQTDLYDYYTRELGYLRLRGAEMARAYPKVASRLSLSGDVCPDPHVERLIESFALLSARLQIRLDSELPEAAAGLLGVICPELLRPTPSMAIARLSATGKQPVAVARGTSLFAERRGGAPCMLRTAYDVTALPVRVERAEIAPADSVGSVPGQRGVPSWALSVARIHIVCDPEAPSFHDLSAGRLRFFLAAEARTAAALYDRILGPCYREGAKEIGRARARVEIPAPGGAVESLPAAVSPVGFAADEALLPFPDNAHPAGRLVQEYLGFPEKFHFFDVVFQPPPGAREITILLFLDGADTKMAVDEGTFVLGCTPVVNVFSRTTEPVDVDHRLSEYKLVADARRERDIGIHSLEEVVLLRAGETEPVKLAPFFSFAPRNRAERGGFWLARREPTGRPEVEGTDVYLSFVDAEFNPGAPAGDVAYARAVCTNRGVAAEIAPLTPLGFERAEAGVSASVLVRPTREIHPSLSGDVLWRLVSTLSLGHMSLCDASALREVLRTWAPSPSADVERRIESVVRVDSRPITRRGDDGAHRWFCRGTEVTVTLDAERLAGHSKVLFGSVLSRLATLQEHVNSFSELVLATSSGREDKLRWPPSLGAQDIL